MSTTTTPVEAGTTYPLPPRPRWAESTTLDGSAVYHVTTTGRFCDIGAMDLVPNQTVRLVRVDSIDEESVEVGTNFIGIGELEMYPEDARVLAALLVQAADLAEQS